jgi:hypothetical protein
VLDEDHVGRQAQLSEDLLDLFLELFLDSRPTLAIRDFTIAVASAETTPEVSALREVNSKTRPVFSVVGDWCLASSMKEQASEKKGTKLASKSSLFTVYSLEDVLMVKVSASF